MYLSNETFETVIGNTPLISIDLVVKNSEGKYLLGFRNNSPAKNFWFVLGGRILKSESMDSAFSRLCRQELGFEYDRNESIFLGVFEHFYDNCVFSDEISTHYVVLGYKVLVDINPNTLPKDQHNKFQWMSSKEIMQRNDVHIHTKQYFS